MSRVLTPTQKANVGDVSDDDNAFLEHSALRTDLDMVEITARFWDEVRPLQPQGELHVVDPYLLDAGGRDPRVHAANVAGLLKPLLRDLDILTFVHGPERAGVRACLEASARLLVTDDTSIRYVRAAAFHHRWVVADRQRLVKMDLSFNRIGRMLGGVDLVRAERDRLEYCAVLNLQDPPHTS